MGRVGGTQTSSPGRGARFKVKSEPGRGSRYLGHRFDSSWAGSGEQARFFLVPNCWGWFTLTFLSSNRRSIPLAWPVIRSPPPCFQPLPEPGGRIRREEGRCPGAFSVHSTGLDRGQMGPRGKGDLGSEGCLAGDESCQSHTSIADGSWGKAEGKGSSRGVCWLTSLSQKAGKG